MKKFLQKLAVASAKNANFSPNFSAKIFLKSKHRSLVYVQLKTGSRRAYVGIEIHTTPVCTGSCVQLKNMKRWLMCEVFDIFMCTN
jgi:hypothetical protein